MPDSLKLAWLHLGWILFFALALLGCETTVEAEDPIPSPSGASREVVLLELFTSQGCSSCPPADRLLRQLGEEEGIAALSFHVDYWNYIGWTDPFSSEQWTERQRQYARALQADTIYTPQLVVDGQAHVVGSRPADVEAAIEEARRRPPAVRLAVSASRVQEDTLYCRIQWKVLTPLPVGAEIWFALYEDDLVTPISAGENRRRTLHNDRVVRALRKVAEPEASGSPGELEISLPLSDPWSRDALGVVVFAQDPRTLGIYGAAATHL